MGEHLAFLMGRSSKDARMYLRKWLREALRQAGIQPKPRGKAGSLSKSLVLLQTVALCKTDLYHIGALEQTCKLLQNPSLK